jgi:hypothetical protein
MLVKRNARRMENKDTENPLPLMFTLPSGFSRKNHRMAE